jgi:hypothetical protein
MSPRTITGAAAGARRASDRTLATSSSNANGLPRVVVGAEVEALHPVADRGGRGQHQDARRRAGPDQRGADCVAVDPGQVPVQDHHVVEVHQGLLDSGRPVVGHVRADALVTQAVGDVVGQLGLILDHQHTHGSMMPCRTSHGHHMTPPGCPSSQHATWPYVRRRTPGRAGNAAARDVGVTPGGVCLRVTGHGARP